MKRESGGSSHGASQRALGAELLVCCSRCGALHRSESDLASNPLCEACLAPALPAGGLGIGHFHALSDRGIAGVVGATSPGNYALGYVDGGDFTVFYVGRADSDLSASLHAWVDAPSRPQRYRSSSHEPWHSGSGPLVGLGTRALGHTAVGIDTAYTHFAFCYAPTAIAAYERECRDYHEHGGSEGLDNPCHPEPPQGSVWACPVHG